MNDWGTPYRCERMLWYTSNTDFGFCQFLREPRIAHKQAILHLKGLIVGFLNSKDWGAWHSYWPATHTLYDELNFLGEEGVASP